MPHVQLMQSVPSTQEYFALNYILKRAKTVADENGTHEPGFDFGDAAVEQKIQALGDHSVMWQRNKQHRDAVRDLLIPLLRDAYQQDYNIGNNAVFRALFAVAIEMHSISYTPMRVLGSTAEAMIKPRP